MSIVDASVIEAKNARPKRNKQGKNSQDLEASYTTKKGADGHLKTTYGYKLHANSDEDGFVLKYNCTPASVHDSKQLHSLLTGHESRIYADAAYKSRAHDQLLCELGIDNQIHERAYRNRSLSDEQKQANTLRSGVRNRVEAVFGILKLHYRIGKASY